jgi:HSP20 family protein
MATKEITRPLNMPVMFEEFFKPFNSFFEGGNMWNKLSKIPPVNILETPNDYTLYLAVPGFKKEDFIIDLNGNYITISLDQKQEWEKEEENFTRREFDYFTFTRSFTLPEDIMFDRIEAKYVDGILKLMLPKKEEAKQMFSKKHIAVN